MFLELKSKQELITRSEVMGLSLIAILLHAMLFGLLLKYPGVTLAETPQMSSSGAESSVTVDLTASNLTPEVPPDKPEIQPSVEPSPVEQPEEAEHAEVYKEAIIRKKPENKPQKKSKSEPKHVSAPKQLPNPVSRSVPSATQTAAAERKAGSSLVGVSPSNHAPTSASDVGAGQSVTAAVSGMQSLGNPAPDYPVLALRRRQEGSVLLRILVLENGRAGEVVVTRSSQSTLLDDAAIKTVQQWRFIPAKRGNIPIKGYAIQTITFRLP